ncbi:MAG: D-alanyl-D-alanine carboxypeptidase [Sphingomonadales bacterium]|nr:D-alanyl-D-alanine carboxypeptidase [Sphingomonadales bacterium]
MFKTSLKQLLFISLSVVVLQASSFTALAQNLKTPARNVLIVDMETGQTLFEKSADTPFPPASMSKLMTTYIAFEMIKEGYVSLDTVTKVNTETWRKWRLQGSTMFLNANEEVTIEQLLKGIIIQSGNDACVVLAEALAGSEDIYVDWMNAKAKELGMSGSHFMNVTGWPTEGHVMTAKDLFILTESLIKDFPDLFSYYGEKEYTHGIDSNSGKPITQPNRNPILYNVQGADGMKTGHTEEAGYSLTGTAKRGDRRIVLVVTGLNSNRARARESQRLMEYSFRNFKNYTLFTKGELVENANVWLGEEGLVPLIVAEDVKQSLSISDRRSMKVKLKYDGPIPAPIKEGQPLASLSIETNSGTRIVPLVAGKSIEEVSGFGRISAAFTYLLFGAAGN